MDESTMIRLVERESASGFLDLEGLVGEGLCPKGRYGEVRVCTLRVKVFDRESQKCVRDKRV